MRKNIISAAIIPITFTISSCGDASTSKLGSDKSNAQRLSGIKAQPISTNSEKTQNSTSNMMTLDKKKTMDNVPNTQSRFTLNSCEKLQIDGASKDVMIGEFLTDFPKELFDEKAVEALDLSGADLTHITANLACAAALSGYGPDVPESALALFASKRHGKSAMAALKRQANGSTDAAKAARQFVDQMKSYLAGPGE